MAGRLAGEDWPGRPETEAGNGPARPRALSLAAQTAKIQVNHGGAAAPAAPAWAGRLTNLGRNGMELKDKHVHFMGISGIGQSPAVVVKTPLGALYDLSSLSFTPNPPVPTASDKAIALTWPSAKVTVPLSLWTEA